MFFKTKPKETASDLLISPAYSAQLTEKHSTDFQWGTSGIKFLDRVDGLITEYSPDTVLDYGCGKATLADAIKDLRPGPLPEVYLYDPGIPLVAVPPEKAVDMLICTDVLEHVEPELIDNVLLDIARLTKKIAYMVIFTGECGNTLPDGRPCHLIQMPRAWWEGKIIEVFGEYFNFTFESTPYPHRFEVIAVRRDEPMTEQEAQERAELVAAILAGNADPVPDTSKIGPAAAAVKRGGLLGSFSYKASE